jgi:hypothetical protein
MRHPLVRFVRFVYDPGYVTANVVPVTLAGATGARAVHLLDPPRPADRTNECTECCGGGAMLCYAMVGAAGEKKS